MESVYCWKILTRTSAREWKLHCDCLTPRTECSSLRTSLVETRGVQLSLPLGGPEEDYALVNCQQYHFMLNPYLSYNCTYGSLNSWHHSIWICEPEACQGCARNPHYESYWVDSLPSDGSQIEFHHSKRTFLHYLCQTNQANHFLRCVSFAERHFLLGCEHWGGWLPVRHTCSGYCSRNHRMILFGSNNL